MNLNLRINKRINVNTIEGICSRALFYFCQLNWKYQIYLEANVLKFCFAVSNKGGKLVNMKYMVIGTVVRVLWVAYEDWYHVLNYF